MSKITRPNPKETSKLTLFRKTEPAKYLEFREKFGKGSFIDQPEYLNSPEFLRVDAEFAKITADHQTELAKWVEENPEEAAEFARNKAEKKKASSKRTRAEKELCSTMERAAKRGNFSAICIHETCMEINALMNNLMHRLNDDAVPPPPARAEEPAAEAAESV